MLAGDRDKTTTERERSTIIGQRETTYGGDIFII